jgi:hypothetical protein
MLGTRFFAASALAGAEFVGRSPGKVVSRFHPEASFSEDEDGGGGGAGFCCAHATPINPNNPIIHKQRRIDVFYRGTQALWKSVHFWSARSEVHKKIQAAQGEALSGLFGESSGEEAKTTCPITSTTDCSARS